MSTCTLNGLLVSFPYEPYDIQKKYMQKVIECLQSSTNAILESPTGTGKTLSLLCSSIAWLLVEKKKCDGMLKFNDVDIEESIEGIQPNRGSWAAPKIIYTSRTHSQLGQAMRELKQTTYKDLVRSVVMGSREQLCLKKEVIEERSSVGQVGLCRALVKGNACSYYHGVEKQKTLLTIERKLFDIEDLMTLGKRQHFCPYYMSRSIKQMAEIVFMPYNYLLDAAARQATGIDLNNSVVIIDEAHNVEKMCEESVSVQITSTDIAMCIQELTHIMKSMEIEENMMIEADTPKDFTFHDLATFKESLLELEKVIDEITLKSPDGDTFEGRYIITLLQKAGIDNQRLYLLTVADKLLQYLSTTRSTAFASAGTHLQRLRDLLTIIHEHDSDLFRTKVAKCFKVFIKDEIVTKVGKARSGGWQKKLDTKKQKVINYWCFSPSFGMDILMKQGVRNIILTSGTLAPLPPLITELGIDIPVHLENPHIVTKDQILIKIVSYGVSNVLLDSSFKNRENKAYLASLGKTIKVFANIIPDGLLVFFPSYYILNQCSEYWQETGIWSDICRAKPIFVEPKGKIEFTNIITEYYNQIKAPGSKGACFMAVCRGKVSEGLDFADENGRGVIITGLPYPPLMDPRVVLKRNYLDTISKENKEFQQLTGQKWYTLEATRAVNQAIGRVIRHRNDYGIILLCDHRFDSPHLKSNLSSWLKNQVQTMPSFNTASSGVCKFFSDAKVKFPTTAFEDSIEKLANPKTVDSTTVSIFHKTGLGLGNASNSCSSPDISSKELLNEYRKRETPEEFKTDSAEVEPSTSRQVAKKRKFNVVPNKSIVATSSQPKEQKETKKMGIIAKVTANFSPKRIKLFHNAVTTYTKDSDVCQYIKNLHNTFEAIQNSKEYLEDLLIYVKPEQKSLFEAYIQKRHLWDCLTESQKLGKSYEDVIDNI